MVNSSVGDAGVDGRRIRRGPRRGAALLVALALAGSGGLAAVLLRTEGGAESPLLTLAFGALLLLAIGGLGWHSGVRLARRQLGEALRDARHQVQVLGQLQPGWHWATDAGHHLIRWQAPQGAVASSWVGAGHVAATQALWERFETEDGSEPLRERLAGGATFADLGVRALEGGAHWRLRGIACHDAQGRFSGYQGTAQRVDEVDEVAVPPPADIPSGAAALIEEHAAFSYTVSHDLRAPLRVVEGFARILKEDYGHQLDRVGNDHLDRVSAAAGRMNGMIDALLSLARLSAQPLACEAVDLTQLAGQVVDELQRATPGRAVDVQLQPQLSVRGDPMLLRMLLENLLGNAWKYTGKCAAPCVALAASSDAQGRRVFCVSDNGAGFDMRFADRLFGAFQRLHSASDFQGTGVGLASVQRIVRRHGGEIWAEAEVGKGARFYFTLG